MIVKCPRCGGDNCHPIFYTRYSMGCLYCDHEFDVRGSFWQRVRRFFLGPRIGGMY